MEIVKKHKYDRMKDIVKCPYCKGKEYFGMTVMRSGHSFCRCCIYELWTQEGYTAARHNEDVRAARYHTEPNYDNLSYWKPSDKDLIFPLYEDGKDYSKEVDDYEQEDSE